MISDRLRALFGACACLVIGSPLSAQVGVVIHGRVEDAVTREAVAGARIVSADSSAAVFTDSLGIFAIQLRPEGPLAVHTERLGYLSQRFDLDDEAPSRISVLLLEPAPVEIQGVTVLSDAAVTVLQRNLQRRRNAYPHAMRAFDRSWLDRFFPVGSAFDLVRAKLLRMRPCNSDPAHICVPGRGVSFSNPYPTVRYTVCVDGWRSIAPINELSMLPVESVALVELYNGTPKEVRVYTSRWMLSRARTGWTGVNPLVMGC